MKRLAIIVEGLTEYEFVYKLLQEHLLKIDIKVINLRGGRISVSSMQNSAKKLVHSHDYVTTLVDYYRFADNTYRQKTVDDLEQEMMQAVPQENFIPYIQKYEFEALIFSDITIAEKKYGSSFSGKFANPEDINHDQPPSKRLTAQFPDYSKILGGVNILEKIGLKKIRSECPRFSAWLEKLENL